LCAYAKTMSASSTAEWSSMSMGRRGLLARRRIRNSIPWFGCAGGWRERRRGRGRCFQGCIGVRNRRNPQIKASQARRFVDGFPTLLFRNVGACDSASLRRVSARTVQSQPYISCSFVDSEMLSTMRRRCGCSKATQAFSAQSAARELVVMQRSYAGRFRARPP
jgi:hypothetical protein